MVLKLELGYEDYRKHKEEGKCQIQFCDKLLFLMFKWCKLSSLYLTPFQCKVCQHPKNPKHHSEKNGSLNFLTDSFLILLKKNLTNTQRRNISNNMDQTNQGAYTKWKHYTNIKCQIHGHFNWISLKPNQYIPAQKSTDPFFSKWFHRINFAPGVYQIKLSLITDDAGWPRLKWWGWRWN